MKKIFLFFTFCFLLIVLSACGKKVMMDELNGQGFYPYSNDALGFSLSLPKEFIYYQTQRNDGGNYQELDVFVPTADQSYKSAVPQSYAEPVVVRVYKTKDFQALSAVDQAKLTKVAEKGGKVYVLNFWDKIPSDWKDKWTDAMKQGLIKNFKVK
ncbi:MAG TPA: hypothetical protein VMD74_04905 [Candidatus Methylomirabilis sp.]|nr:hypothetical protein [Candidatus Methylomirabilis sp.]